MTSRRDDARVSPETSGRTATEKLRRSDDAEMVEREYEDAQGQEVFSDPDAVVPASSIVEGAEGEETFTSDKFDDAEDRRDD